MILGVIGSCIMLDPTEMTTARAIVGLSILSSAMIIGLKTTFNMFCKIVGTEPNSLIQSSDIMGVSIAAVTLMRIASCYWNIALVQSGGYYGVFLLSCSLYVAAMFGQVLGMDFLVPHASYLLAK